MITQRKHSFYNANCSFWEKALLAYSGGANYIEANLVKHIAETDVSFEERRQRAYYFNYPRRIANLITRYALSTEPIRRNADPNILNDFNKERINTNEFMRKVSTMINVYGCVWIVVKMPYFEGTLNLSDKSTLEIRPFANAISPLDVTDWSFDANGKLNWIIVREVARNDRNPFVKAIEAIRYTLYTKETIAVYEEINGYPKVISEVRNPIGEVPVFRVQEYDGYYLDSKHYFEDIIRISNAIFNNESEAQMNIIKQMFGIMVIPETFAQSAQKHEDEKNAKMSTVISRSTAIIESAEDKGITRFIAPAGVETTVIRAENKALKEEMYDIVGMALNSTSKSMQTAESKSWDFHSVSTFMQNRADLLEQTENQIWELFNKFDNSISNVVAVYSRDFSIKDLMNDMQALLQISSIPNVPLSMQKQIARASLEVMERISPVDDKVKNEILSDIDKMENAPTIDPDFKF